MSSNIIQHRIAIFASGGGSNAEKIIQYFQSHDTIQVALVVCNRKEAGVLPIAEKYNIPSLIIKKSSFYETTDLLMRLEDDKVDFLVLAGFLLLVPQYIIERYHKKIINIHPALLPQYGGAGMYGMNVHEAVKAANEPFSGITIHYATTHYDEGDIIFQAQCPLSPNDTANDIAEKVLALEHRYFAPTIEKLLLEL